MKKYITADNFYKKWIEFIHCKDKDECFEKWQSSKHWTDFILGSASASSKGSPFGDFFSEPKNWKEKVRYRTEDGKFDMTMSMRANYSPVNSLNSEYDLIETPNPAKEIYYPTVYDVLIEHENSLYESWHEIAKLAFGRSYLKVLITYHSDNIKPEHAVKERVMMKKNFQLIVGESTLNFADHPETEYLLILGKISDKEIKWSGDVFDHAGKHIVEINE